MCEDDPVVARVRAARKRIFEECGNDPLKIHAWAKKIEARYADRVQRYDSEPAATDNEQDALRRRSEERRKRIVGNRAHSWQEAEDWDLAFWQSLTPQQRLEAHASLLEDMKKVEAGKAKCHCGSQR